MSRSKKLLVICPYPQGVAAGQRLKYEQYFDHWRRNGFEITVSSYMDVDMWDVVFKKGHYLSKAIGLGKGHIRRTRDLLRIRQYDLVYVFMWTTPFGTTLFDRAFRTLARRMVFDLEDFVVIRDVDPNEAFWRRVLRSNRKTMFLIENADHIISSSPHLNEYCEANNRKHAATFISSSVDTDRYEPVNTYSNDKTVTIGWTGTFSSLEYLELLRKVFLRLNERCKFKLRVICNADFHIPGIDLEVIQWTKEREVEDLQGIDIGVYPLPVNDWVLGKSGLKAIQYMAFGLPTVATNVGTTPKIINHMQNGWLVKTEDEWVEALETLVNQPELRKKLGLAARETVLERYSIRATESQYFGVLEQSLASGQSR